MKHPCLRDLRIQGYGCIHDATLHLTPLHALIGPNDSGKSTLLRALRTLAFLLADPASVTNDAPAHDDLLRALRGSHGIVRFEASSDDATWHVEIKPDEGRMRWSTCSRGERPPSFGDRQWPQPLAPLAGAHPPASITRVLGGARVLRFDADALRAPHALLPETEPIAFADDRGTGLPAVYDALLIRDLPAFLALNADVARRFPDVESVRLTNTSRTEKAIAIQLVGGVLVPAERMSDGLLYYLAYTVLRHIDHPPLLLIERPENALHPSTIGPVMRALREISGHVQVIVATHSPVVVNELLPEEVTVMTRSRERGTEAVRMEDLPPPTPRAEPNAFGDLLLARGPDDDG